MEQIQEKFNFPITMGDMRYNNAYSFFINSMLVIYDYRPSFLIQQVDFSNNEDYSKILVECLSITPTFLRNPSEFSNEEEYERYINNNSLVCVEHQQGLLITKSKFLDDKFFKLLLLNSVEDDDIFGNILGYPCAGDTPSLEDSRNGNRIAVHITMRHNQNQEIFSNICFVRNIQKIIQKFNEMNTFVSRLNPEFELQINY